MTSADRRVVALGRELRRLHDRIRGVLDDARLGLEPVPGARGVVADPLARCRAFCSVLDTHHRREDADLFPWLRTAHPELAGVVTRLEEDHRLVATLLEDLARALDDQAAPEVVLRHLEGLDAIMENHFRYEERALAPILDAVVGEGGPDLDDTFWEPR